ncbi:MAG: hypothetical protein K2Q33_08700 [Gammaproteobacteria bacterium]|nr:hypothetical protein [Gammaproteobacteria bacterium]
MRHTLISFKNGERFSPTDIYLTQEQFEINQRELSNDPDLAIGSVDTLNYYTREKMEKDIRGVTLDNLTKVAFLNGNSERNIIAARRIDAGTILGAYYGTVMTDRKNPPGGLDLGRWNHYGCSLRMYFHNNTTLEIINTPGTVIPTLCQEKNPVPEKHCTRMGLINHAFNRDDIKAHYRFYNPSDVEHASIANIRQKLLHVTYCKDGQEYDIRIVALVANRTIQANTSLLWTYGSYSQWWQPFGRTPRLFDNRNDKFLDTDLYFPLEFNITVAENVNGRKVPITLSLAQVDTLYLGNAAKKDKVLFDIEQSTHLKISEEQIKAALQATGINLPYFNQRNRESVKKINIIQQTMAEEIRLEKYSLSPVFFLLLAGYKAYDVIYQGHRFFSFPGLQVSIGLLACALFIVTLCNMPIEQRAFQYTRR